MLPFGAEFSVFHFKDLKIKMYRTIILPVVLCGSETLSLTLRVGENRVLRRLFGPKREELTEEWRKLHNEDPNDLYSSPNTVRMGDKIEKNEMVVACSAYG